MDIFIIYEYLNFDILCCLFVKFLLINNKYFVYRMFKKNIKKMDIYVVSNIYINYNRYLNNCLLFCVIWYV